MDFINRAAAQLRELFESLSPSTRLLAGLLLAAVVISAGVMYPSSGETPQEVLLGGENLSDSQLNRMEAAIAQAGLTQHRREGRQIWVPSEQKAAYLAAVADADALPPNFNSLLERALDKGGPLESREATRERLKIANQQTLSEIVRAMHWVEDAVVLYDEQEPRGLSGKREVIGSVSVRPKQGEPLDARRIHTLQTLVAHAVVGLRPDDVAVTNLGEGDANETHRGTPPEVCDDDSCQARIAYEQYKRQSILNALSDIPGVRAEVNAEPDDGATCDQPPESQSTGRDVRERSKAEASSNPGGEHAGTFAQGPSRTLDTEDATHQADTDPDAELAADESSTDESRSPQRNDFSPGRVWATITIPQSYIEGVWKQRHLGALERPTEADLLAVQENVVAKVESIVEPLLPRSDDHEVVEKPVRVVVLESVAATPGAFGSITSQAWTWASGRGSTLAVLGLAVFGLLAVRWIFPAGNEKDKAAASTRFTSPRRFDLREVQDPTLAPEPRTLNPDLPTLQFDDLARLDDATLAVVIHEVDPDVMALALTGASDELMARILGHIPQEIATTFREQLSQLGPTRLSDVEAAQQVVASVAELRLNPPQPIQGAA